MDSNATALSRRSFLKASGATTMVLAAGAIINPIEAWGLEVKALKPETMRTLIQMARDIYPHDRLADRYYAVALKGYDGAAADDAELKKLLESGAAALDSAAQAKHGVPYAEIGWEADRTNDEWASFVQISWLDPRTTSGSWRVARDFSGLPAWICKTVGGSTTHWAGASLRIQEHEFKARTTYGDIDGANLLDWPLTLEELEPYYSQAEDRMGVTRTHDIPGLPGNNNFMVMYAGAKRVGYKDCPHRPDGHQQPAPQRPPESCQQIGFCFQGCKTGAKWSTLYTEIPEAAATSHFELRTDAQALRIEHDAGGKVTGVLYADAAGNQHLQKARAVAVAGNSIESPRLLLNSASSMFPDGLANSSGQVGRNYMRHMTASVYAILRPAGAHVQGHDDGGHRDRRIDQRSLAGLRRGLRTGDPVAGPAVHGRIPQSRRLGARVRQRHGWSYENMAGLWIVGEDMPQESNAVTLHPEVKDQHGLPVPDVRFDDHPNDIAMRAHAWRQGQALYDAVGAVRTLPTPPYPSTHNLGTNRMSERPADGVVNKWGQTHDIANLFVSDGSQFTTGAAENPTLTIVALALRQADYIADQMGKDAI
jgi:choline dehydrogenase-like flavoprotein